MINFPTTLDTLSNPTSTDLLENATAALDHDVQHSNANDAIEALEAKVGADSSAVTTSHDYKLSGVTGSDKAVSKTGTETLTNKTLTSPVINVGSDATGDIWYRNAGGLFTRLAAGATDTILAIQSGLPAWISNPSASDSSYTVKGIVKFLTNAATSGVTVASGVANVNMGTGANQVVQLNASSQLPAVDGSLLTGISTGKIDITTSDATVTGTGSETDFYTVSIAGGTLGTNGGVFGRVYFDWASTTTTVKTIKMIYGTTTVATFTATPSATTNFTGSGHIDFQLFGNASVSAQDGSFFIDATSTHEFLPSTATIQFIRGAAKGTATETSSGALNLKFSVTQNTGDTFILRHAFTKKI